MSKFATIFTLVLLLSFGLIFASRPSPAAFRDVSSLHEDVVAKDAWRAGLDDDCDLREKATDEECLMRRTLAAHTDYIYTQKHKPKP